MTDFIDHLYRKSKEWHARRRSHIGGSDANIIMGPSNDDLIRLWREKRGEAEPEDLSSKLPVLMGLLSEPLNLAWLARKMEFVITRQGEYVEHPSVPLMAATLDGWVEAEKAAVECKHIGGFVPWTATVETYFPQCQHIMAVTGARHTYLSVFVGSNEWRCERIEFDPLYADVMIDAERQFWQCVQDGTPPCPLPPIKLPQGEISRVVDMTGSNSWADSAVNWLDNKEAAAKYDEAIETLKMLVEPDVREASGHGIKATRDRRGSIRIRKI